MGWGGVYRDITKLTLYEFDQAQKAPARKKKKLQLAAAKFKKNKSTSGEQPQGEGKPEEVEPVQQLVAEPLNVTD